MLIEHRGVAPSVAESAYIAPTAVVCGDVEIGEDCRIMFGAVLVAEDAPVRVGARTVIMENAVVRAWPQLPVSIGTDVMIGPGANVNGAEVDHDAFIAAGASLFPAAQIGARAVVRTNSVVHINSELPPGRSVPERVDRDRKTGRGCPTGRGRTDALLTLRRQLHQSRPRREQGRGRDDELPRTVRRPSRRSTELGLIEDGCQAPPVPLSQGARTRARRREQPRARASAPAARCRRLRFSQAEVRARARSRPRRNRTAFAAAAAIAGALFGVGSAAGSISPDSARSSHYCSSASRVLLVIENARTLV